MEIINIKNNKKYLEEYCKLCYLEWGNSKEIEINNFTGVFKEEAKNGSVKINRPVTEAITPYAV